jgi:hypothetical protein
MNDREKDLDLRTLVTFLDLLNLGPFLGCYWAYLLFFARRSQFDRRTLFSNFHHHGSFIEGSIVNLVQASVQGSLSNEG